MDLLRNFLETKSIHFEQDIPLFKKSWIKQGGICRYWVVPDSKEQLETICRFLNEHSLCYDIVGQTSNIFFYSSYHPEIVVSTVKVNRYEIVNDKVICDCGVSVMKLAKAMLNQDYAGFYGLVGLPGTVASSVVNNAGCFGCSVSSMLESVDCLLPDGSVQTLTREQLGYAHRSSVFKRGELRGVILSVKLKITKFINREEELEKLQKTVEYRKHKQEGLIKNLGSTFSHLTLKKNIKNIVAYVVAIIAEKLKIAEKQEIFKRLLLAAYGYKELNNYISDKNVNTYVWRDKQAENMFPIYKEFMNKVFKNLTLEIEERILVNSKPSKLMKIGILTYHRAENYGALLQAYALKTYLSKQGYDVSFVDYWPEYHRDYFKMFPIMKFKKGNWKAKAQSLFDLLWIVPRFRRKRILKGFMTQHLGLAEKAEFKSDKKVISKFDIIVFGSDQIWRKQGLPGFPGFDFMYFGSDNLRAKKISYAASMGPFKQVSEEERTKMNSCLEKFAALSVREESLKDFLNSMELSATLVCDPVLLLSTSEWRFLEASRPVAKQKDYILFYNLLNSPVSTRFANALSRQTELPIIEVTKKYGLKYIAERYHHTDSVLEFLSLVDNARYVVSNSFHGVAFSILFHKQFYVVGMGNKVGRVSSLLDVLQIKNRIFESDICTPCSPIDYASIRDNFDAYVKRSQDFLHNSIIHAQEQ